MSAPRIAVLPEGRPEFLTDAVRAGGGEPSAIEDADALVWADPVEVTGLRDVLAGAPNVRWVQLPYAGVERHAAAGLFADGRTWTCGKGVYAEPVAEMALAAGLAGLRNLYPYAAATTWTPPAGRSLYDGKVTILGGGGITASLIDLLRPWRAEVTVVRRSGSPMDGATRVATPDHLHEALAEADLVVLALALTPETAGIIGRAELAAMADHAWLVNVARGRHVVTDDLVDALREGSIGGAALDVTDPEPLPTGHPLWDLPNCLITPHTGNTPEMARAPLAARIAENVRRFAAGEPLIGLVDADLGY